MNLGGLLSIFSKKDQSVLGIDIGSSAIKVVQIKKKRGKMVLETYGELALGPYAGIEIGRATSLGTEKVAIALKDILKEAKTTTLSAGVALPLSSSLISFVTLPKVDEKQMGDVIALEARKYIPVPMSEVMLDWSLIPREGTFNTEEKDKNNENEKDLKDQKNLQKEMQDVLILAIHNEYINTYQNIMNVATIKPSFFEVELFSSIRAVVDQGIQSVMIIDVGASSTKLYIVERGVLRASHIINKGSQDITLALSKALSIGVNEAENMKRVYGLKGGPEYKELTEIITINLDYVFYEANATLLNYQKKYNKNISKIILTGGGVLLKGFIDLARISLETEVVYANPFGKLETPAFLAEQFIQSGPEFAVAIGTAIRRLSETQ
ncbi:MAG TPA: pilus assembly protein PilM [Candidatus Paceibacterota bacterium]